jgi:hypothetical protein
MAPETSGVVVDRHNRIPFRLEQPADWISEDAARGLQLRPVVRRDGPG